MLADPDGRAPLTAEAQIRPPDLKRELAEYLARDRARWLAGRARWVAVPCPACAGSGAEAGAGREAPRRFVVRDYPFAECAACGTVYHDPRPTESQLAEYYAAAESYRFWAERIFPATAQRRREAIARPLAERTTALAGVRKGGAGDAGDAAGAGGSGGLLIEIGAGAGLFLEEIRALGAFDEVLAVEPTPSLADVLRAKGFPVIQDMAAGVSLPAGRAAAVCAFEVIEHVFGPGDFLRALGRALRPGGLLVLSCPNIRGFDFQALGYDQAENFGLEHINMFHPASLALLLERCGFTVVQIATPGRLDADLVRQQILDGRLDVRERPFLQRVLVAEWDRLGGPFQTFLQDNGLSSNMVVAARRTGG